LFSIIIPLYNKEKHIKKAIDSVLNQSYKRFELIVVNDGSTDRSLEIVEELFQKMHIAENARGKIRIINQPNQGVSAARNNGVKNANSNYIAFLDADDWWDRKFLEEQARLIKLFPEADIYGTGYFRVKNGRLIKSQIGYEDNYSGYIDYFTSYKFKWYMPLTSISVVIPKITFLEQNGFNEQLKFGEDFHLWIRLAISGNVAYINKPLAYYNQDVAVENRAIGEKIWEPDAHYIFNLNFLEKEEKNNPKLKALLDGLRVQALLRYHLSGKFLKETNIELKKVDFSKQNRYYRRIYHYPVFLIKRYFSFKKILSRIKQKIILVS
jgi:glycosyltransferase involved in cell wall biosynthesis